MPLINYQLEIRRPDKPPVTFPAETGIYYIGTDHDCHLRLYGNDIENRHAILTITSKGELWIEDLDSSSGTFINGRKVNGRILFKPCDTITIGQFEIILSDNELNKTEGLTEEKKHFVPENKIPPPPSATPSAVNVTVTPKNEPDVFLSIKQQIHKALVERLDLKRMTIARIQAEELREKARHTIKEIVEEVKNRLPTGVKPETLIEEVFAEAVGLGPLEPLLKDPEVTEIMVNGHAQIYVERKGRLELTGKQFMDDASVLAIIERIVSPIGRRIDESQPYVDARLPDGSRVNAIIHPLSLIGPCLTIRKFSSTPLTENDLIRLGTWTKEMADFCRTCVILRKNIIVSGGTGSGKTTLLNVLSNYLPSFERIITIEDAAELRMNQEHVIRLEARPPNIEGRGAITIRDLVRNSLRMRPDRIVVGECRGGEALDMLQAMNTGHDGSLTTLHANSPRDALARLETMVLMAGMDLPARAIRDQIASAIHLIVHTARLPDGKRKVLAITEITGMEGDVITLQDIFVFRQTGISPTGEVIGHFEATGAIPKFVHALKQRGIPVDMGIFA